MRHQVEIEALAYKKFFGFLSVPVELLYLWEFDFIIIGYRMELLGLELPLEYGDLLGLCLDMSVISC